MNTLFRQLAATACAILLLLTQVNFAYATELGGFPLGIPGGDDPGVQLEPPTQDTAPPETPPEEPPAVETQPPTDGSPQEPPVKQEVVQIFNLNLFLGSRILPVGDAARWAEEQQWIQEEFSFFGGLTAQGDEVELVPASIDCSAVVIDEVGSYEVIIRLIVSDSFADGFFLPEALGTIHIPVYVADPAEFALFPSAVKQEQMVVTWLYPSAPHLPISVFYRGSDVPLTAEEVNLLPCEDTVAVANSNNSVLKINREALQTGMHYYFQIEQNGVHSDILHLVDDGREISSDGMSGDRDGGDRDEQTPPPVTVPPPVTNPPDTGGGNDGNSGTPPADDDETDSTPPVIVDISIPLAKDDGNAETGSTPPAKEEPANPLPPAVTSNENAANGTNTAPTPATPTPSAPQGTPDGASTEPEAVPEEDTQNYTVFSGRRLLQMQKATDVLRVKKNHITVDLPWAWEGFSALTEDSRFKVEILALSPSSVSVEVLLNGAPPLSALPVTLTMPYTPASGDASITVCGQTGKTYPATYDAALQTLTFTAEEPGTFTVSEQTEEPAVPGAPKRNASPFSIAGMAGMAGIAVLLLAGGFWGFRRMRKAGHSHE